MIEFLKRQLGKEYRVNIETINGCEKIKVNKLENNILNQETHVELVHLNDNNVWELYEVQRGKSYSLGQFNDKNIGLSALNIATFAVMGSSWASNDVRNELRLINKNDVSEAENILKNNLKQKYYSLSKEVPGAINLESLDSNKYNIYYLSLTGEKITIVKNREAPSIYVVMYNYGIKLECFNNIIKKWKQEINIDLILNEKLKRIFLRK